MKRFFKTFLGYLLRAIIFIVMIVGIIAPYIFAYIHHWLWLIPAIANIAILIIIFVNAENRL